MLKDPDEKYNRSFYVGRFNSNGNVIEGIVNETRDKVRELPGFFQINKKPSTLLQSSTHSSNNPTPTVPPEAQPNLGELQESTKGEVVPRCSYHDKQRCKKVLD